MKPWLMLLDVAAYVVRQMGSRPPPHSPPLAAEGCHILIERNAKAQGEDLMLLRRGIIAPSLPCAAAAARADLQRRLGRIDAARVRARESLSRSMIAPEAPGWRGATKAHTARM